MKITTLSIAAMLATLSLLSQPVLATQSSEPTQCPSVAAIKSVELNYAAQYSSRYNAINVNNYGTTQNWIFGIGDIPADSAADALYKAKTALTTLNGNPIPLYDSDDKRWICIYHNNNGYMSFAMTTS
jgi:hypothetical protein